MKRINLILNLEDNEILEENINQLLLGQARKIARETYTKELSSELERITTKTLNELKNVGYYNTTANRITDIIVQRLGKEISINSAEVNKLVEEKVASYLDSKIESRGGLDNFLQAYMNKSIGSLLTKNAND